MRVGEKGQGERSRCVCAGYRYDEARDLTIP